MPSKRPIGVLNCCARARSAPVARTASFAMPVFDDGQRDAAPRGEALHQHPPAACPSIGAPPMTQSIGMNTSLARVRAVLEHRVERHVPAADVHARDASSESARR